MNDQYRQWLCELTALPTAAGREDRVIAWVRRWAKARPEVQVRADRYGNLLLQRRGVAAKRPAGAPAGPGNPGNPGAPGAPGGPAPIYFQAHMDHPGFVVTAASVGRDVQAEFRGSVQDAYFLNTPVLLWHGDDPPRRGAIRELVAPHDKERDQRVRIELDAPAPAAVADVVTWDTGPQRVEGEQLHTLGCDDVAGVAAAVAAFDVLLQEGAGVAGAESAKPQSEGATSDPGAIAPSVPSPQPSPAPGTGRGGPSPDIRLLLTRAEEYGFLGAIGACKARSIPRRARLITLENSKSFADSPIGGGPIVRVGDKACIFDPDLTYRASKLAEALATRDPAFLWQRKLMAGGTCEASVFGAYGYQATGLCVPLGNYHNMNPATGRIEAETISLRDWDGLVHLLVALGRGLDDSAAAPPFLTRLEDLFARRGMVVGK